MAKGVFVGSRSGVSGLSVSMLGAKEIEDAFKQLATREQVKVFVGASVEAMKGVADKARALAPKRSGTLAKGLALYAMNYKTQRQGKVYGARVVMPTRRVLARKYPKAESAEGYYPAAQEFGWRKRGKGGKTAAKAGTKKAFAGKPYLRKALYSSRGEVMQVLAAEIYQRTNSYLARKMARAKRRELVRGGR